MWFCFAALSMLSMLAPLCLPSSHKHPFIVPWPLHWMTTYKWPSQQLHILRNLWSIYHFTWSKHAWPQETCLEGNKIIFNKKLRLYDDNNRCIDFRSICWSFSIDLITWARNTYIISCSKCQVSNLLNAYEVDTHDSKYANNES